MIEINKLLNLLINYTERPLQDNVVDKNQYESLCKIFKKHIDENKNES